MYYICSIGALFLAPLVTLAHDGDHLVTAWYQNPVAAGAIILGISLLALLGYGFSQKKRKLVVAPAIAFAMLSVSSLAMFTMDSGDTTERLAASDFGIGHTVTLFKSPNCGCCSGHAAALEAAGFTVTIEETTDLPTVKQSLGIPQSGESCHTSVIDDYVVEGHVPLEAIEKLLRERPDIAGIGLPGMPIGTPGMPGPKVAPYKIYQLTEAGGMSPYLTI